MIRHPPRSTLFPNTTLSGSVADEPHRVGPPGSRAPGQQGVAAVDVAKLLGGGACPLGFRVDLSPPHIGADRKSTRLNSSHANISYAVFCLKKKKTKKVDNLY